MNTRVVVVAEITVHDAERMRSYSRVAPDTLTPFGGKFLYFGQKESVLCGRQDTSFVGVIEFPDQAAVSAWYHSPAYQALLPIRDAACSMTLTSYNELALAKWREQAIG